VEDLPSDGDVIRESLSHPAVFEVVFDRHYDSIYRYLARRVGPDAGGDLASEVFLIAFARRHHFRADAESAAPWLYGIAANLARRQARSWRRARRARSRTIGANVIWLDPPPEERLDAESLRRVLLATIAQLKPNDREVLLLHALTDLSYSEIATALSIPIGTVRSRLARARRQVRALLTVAGHHELAAEFEAQGDGDVR